MLMTNLFVKGSCHLQLNKLKIIEFDEIDSTNDYLKNNYKNYENLTVIKTKFQTNGRGQFERKWESIAGENLLCSFLLIDMNINKIDFIKQIVVESLIILLNKYDISGKFKEPNDIYINNKKILGILIETNVKPNTNFYNYIIIGIGLNINQENFSIENATSMSVLNNTKYSVDAIMKDLIDIFIQNFNQKMLLLK